MDPKKELDNIVTSYMKNELRQQTEPQTQPLFETVDQYQQATGKRFRMTKDQKTRGISRQDAFKEFVTTLTK